MREARNQNHQKRQIVILLAIIALVIAGTLFLIFRGSKVQGPNQSESLSQPVASTSKSATTTLGTYVAKGTITDLTGNPRSLTMYLQLQKNNRYRRQLRYDLDTSPLLTIDSGRFEQADGQLHLTSTQAISYGYANQKGYQTNRPNAINRYGSAADPQIDIPESMQRFLDTTVTLTAKKPTRYQYLASRLRLKASQKKLPTVAAFANSQSLVKDITESATSSSSHFVASSTSSSSESESSDKASSNSSKSSSTSSSSESEQGFVPSAEQIAIGRQQLQAIGVDDSQFSDAQIEAAIIESAARGGDSVIPLLVPDYRGDQSSIAQNHAANVGTGTIKYADQAYAILLQRYPDERYSAQQIGMTEDASGFTFSVTNRTTYQTKTVTVTGDGKVVG